MQRQSGQRLFSATDLVSFVECDHLTALDLRALDDAALAAMCCVADESDELNARKGNEHELAYLERLLGKGFSVFGIAE